MFWVCVQPVGKKTKKQKKKQKAAFSRKQKIKKTDLVDKKVKAGIEPWSDKKVIPVLIAVVLKTYNQMGMDILGLN